MMQRPSDFPPIIPGLAPIPGRGWYALRMDGRGMMPQTNQRGEDGADITTFPAQRGLERRGYPTYVPTELWSRRRNRFTRLQRVYTTKPLVPGLLFVCVPLSDRGTHWLRVMSSPFVRGVYGRLQAVRDADLAGVHRMVDEAARLIADPYSLAPEDKIVLPVETPLAGQEAEITIIDVPNAVAEAVTMLFGRAVRITVPMELLAGVRKEDKDA